MLSGLYGFIIKMKAMKLDIKDLELCDVLKDGEIILNEVPFKDISNEHKLLVDYEIYRLDLIQTEEGENIEIGDAVITTNNKVYRKDDALYEYYTGEYYSPDTEMFDYIDDTKVSQKTIDNCCLVFCYHNHKFIDREDVAFCEDIEDYVSCDDCYYSDDDDCFYYNEENIPKVNNRIKEYHHSPEPKNLNDGFSPFSIGFEIEKIHFFGLKYESQEVGEYELFKGFELDSSCGVEAITNILPLSSSNKDIQEYVFTLFDEASNIINSEYNNSCGGHITISAKLYNGFELFDKLRSSLSIFYALYRYRLNNGYCNENKSAKRENNTKRSPIHIKENCLEIRLPNAVKNVEQLKLRYKLTAVIVEHCLQTNDTFEDLLNKITPILKEMYNDNDNKIEFIKSLSKDFWKYLNIGEISQNIKEFVK